MGLTSPVIGAVTGAVGRPAGTVDTVDAVNPAGAVGSVRQRLGVVGVTTLLAVAAAGLTVVAGRLAGAPGGSLDPVQAAGLLALLVLTAFLGLEYRIRGHGDRLDLFDAALGVALVCLDAPQLVVVVVAVKVLAFAVQRVPVHKAGFNVAQWACAAAAGAVTMAALRDPGPATGRDVALLLLALTVVAAVNTACVLLVLVAVSGLRLRDPALAGLLAGSAVSTPVNLLLGAASAALWLFVAESRLAIPVALVAVHLGTRAWAQRQAAGARLAGLQRLSAVLAGPDDLRAATPHLLAELRRSFECAGAELHLGGAPAPPQDRDLGLDLQGHDRSAALVSELVRRGDAVRLALPATGPSDLLALLARAGWRDCLAAPARLDGHTVGLLVTHDRNGWQGFEQAELDVLKAAAAVVAESVRRTELADVLRVEQAAVTASEGRWQVLARILGLVARGTPLGPTLAELAVTLQEQTAPARCAVLVTAPGTAPVLAAPSLPADALPQLEQLLLEASRADRPAGWTREVGLDRAGGRRTAALARAHVRTVQAWALPCSPDSGGRGVLALCYPTGPGPAEHARLAAGAARIGGVVVDHVLVQNRLAHQAAHDPLTDLPNRSVFLDRLGHALRGTERDGGAQVMVLFLDLDRFKGINDSLGHAAGDELLCAVADRLRTVVRPGDTVARFGGDEFTMLCEGITDTDHAVRIVRRVQDTLHRPFLLGPEQVLATSSIGMALGSGSELAAETLVSNADAAMYRAKESGGDRFEVFHGEPLGRAVHRLGW